MKIIRGAIVVLVMVIAGTAVWAIIENKTFGLFLVIAIVEVLADYIGLIVSEALITREQIEKNTYCVNDAFVLGAFTTLPGILVLVHAVLEAF